MEAMSEAATISIHDTSPITTSPEIVELAKALPKAQAAIAKITRDATNPHFNSKYASLTEIADAVLPAMNSAGITVLQPVATENDTVKVTTILLHESGQWLRSTHSIPVSKRDAQGYGSALTYARRQALQALLTVAPQGEDDDAENAVGRGSAARPPIGATPPKEPERPTLAKRVAHLEKTLNDVRLLKDEARAWDLARDLRAELKEKEPATLARLEALHERRHSELLSGGQPEGAQP
jgi:hypothetical protein